MIAAAWTVLAGAAGACEPSTTIDASRPVWPSREAMLDVPPGVVFWATDLAPEPTLTDSAGAPVALDVVAHPGGVWAVIPAAPLVVGGSYALSDADGSWATLTVVGSAEVPSPPAPIRRTLISEQFVAADETMCGGSWSDHTVSSLSYELCLDAAGVVGVYAVGGPPAVPTVADFGDATWHASPDWLAIPMAGAGASTTVWFGAFGADGAFSGWSSDDAVLPLETDVMRRDRMTGVEEDATPPEWFECPSGDWILGELQHLGEVEPQDAGGSARSSGCSSTGAPAGGLGAMFLGLLGARGRRRPGRAAVPAPAP